LLDRLLASPQFGERWGRHWLDVVGYTDTVGFDVDATTVIQSEGKWRYRDYVISAFNQDKSFARFVTEQVAGDELFDWRHAAHFTPEMRELLIATGYLRTARDESHEPESNIPLIYYGVLHDTLEIVGSSLLGLTLNCARCHDHKFDPISQQDYYRLMALFTPAYNPKAWKPVFPWKPEIQDRGLADLAPAEREAIERSNREIDRQINDRKRQVTELRRPYETRLLEAKLQKVPEPIRADTRTAVALPAAKRNEIQKYLADKFSAALTVKPEEVAAALSPADKLAQERLQAEVARFESQRRSFGKLQALYDVGPPPPTYFLKRGNHETLGAVVEPGFLSVLTTATDKPVPPTPAGGLSSGRRTALAQWLTRPDSPAAGLMARVLVNRLWQHLFGQGIVATPENFGTSGELPTHPELLDWLATEFMRNGWQIKPMLKLMMCSAAYRQSSSSAIESRAASVDPGNQLLWRMRLRRLEAEVIRDTILRVSGRLNLAMGGPPLSLEARPDGQVEIAAKQAARATGHDRRSVYLLARRAYNLSLLTVFDQPLVATTCPRRDASAVPLQSLAMLNDAFVAEQAEHFATQVERLAGTKGDQKLPTAFRLALSREPNASELGLCVGSLERQAALYRSAGLTEPQAAHKALVELCHTLFNTSEFLYAE
jgi:hypothetical protein